MEWVVDIDHLWTSVYGEDKAIVWLVVSGKCWKFDACVSKGGLPEYHDFYVFLFREKHNEIEGKLHN